MEDNEKFAASSFKDFINVTEIHRSNSGYVYIATYKYDKKKYLLKERKISEMGKKKSILIEAYLLRQLNHQNVVKCEGWFTDDLRTSIFIVIEYCYGEDLYQFIQKQLKINEYLNESFIWNIFSQICEGVMHLHENGIIHRDLKLLNIMICGDVTIKPIIKIIDLGISRQLTNDTMFLNTFYGTPLYLR